jgi:hypothetical protein
MHGRSVTASIRRLAILVTGLALLAPAPAASGHGPTGARAQKSGVHLTISEARRQIRYRIRRLARKRGDTDLDYEIEACVRLSARRVRCRTNEDYKSGLDGDSYNCSGFAEVVEFRDRYRTRGKGTRCV